MDWERKRVEVECKIVLREGLLETLVCSPGTKEHESILVTEVRPLHIFQALGMLGLEPGSPPSYDREKRTSIAATGARLAIQVKTSHLPARPMESWIWEVNGKRPLAAQDWVFAGSTHSEQSGFGADVEGTIVAVVDFPTSLIALPEPHTESNDQLWLSARTESIPPLGTRCTVVIQAEEACVLRLQFENGVLRSEERGLEPGELQAWIRNRQNQETLTRIEVGSRQPMSPDEKARVQSVLNTAGVEPSFVRFVTHQPGVNIAPDSAGNPDQKKPANLMD